MQDQAPSTPARPHLNTQPETPSINLEAQSHILAKKHHRQAQIPQTDRQGSSGGDLHTPDAASLLSARIPRFTSILKEAASRLQAQTTQAGRHSPAAEWLLDNYYIVAQVLREVQQDLPPHYERELPRLQTV